MIKGKTKKNKKFAEKSVRICTEKQKTANKKGKNKWKMNAKNKTENQ